MKIHQLPIGARFEYEGEEYVKTGPMFGTGKGGQRFVPKYAVLKALDVVEAAGEPAGIDAVAKATVLQAFGSFYAECRQRLPPDQWVALDAARDRFLRALA